MFGVFPVFSSVFLFVVLLGFSVCQLMMAIHINTIFSSMPMHACCSIVAQATQDRSPYHHHMVDQQQSCGQSLATSSAIAGPCSDPHQLSRDELASILVRFCDRNRDHYLDCNEMRELARRTGGANYSNHQWSVEYTKLANEFNFHPDQGMPRKTARALLDDLTGAGAYMSTDQLVRAVVQVRKDHHQERTLLVNKQRQDHDRSCQVVVLHSVAHVILHPRRTEHGEGPAPPTADIP